MLQRIVREHRRALTAILVAAIANLLVYLFVVLPLAARSAGAADRALAAANNLRAARSELAAAQALVTGKTEAERELVTFYDKVLPSSQSAARRMTYAALPLLANRANVKYREGRYEALVDLKRNDRLGRLHIRMVLEGDYDKVRRFIYELETSPEFVIIDDVTLTQDDPAKPLQLTLELSTYFRLESNGN